MTKRSKSSGVAIGGQTIGEAWHYRTEAEKRAAAERLGAPEWIISSTAGRRTARSARHAE